MSFMSQTDHSAPSAHVTVPEFAAMCGETVRVARGRIEKREIDFERVGLRGTYLIKRVDAEEFAKARLAEVEANIARARAAMSETAAAS